MSAIKVIFFDRDGTLIVDERYLNDYKKITYLPKVFETLYQLKDLGYHFVVVTNQSGIARGIVTEEQMHKIHQVMIDDFKKHNIEFLDFYYSPHLPESNHPSRKPNPGMLLQAAQEHNIDLTQSWMVGDKISDVEAGHNAGCKSILICNEKSATSIQNLEELLPIIST